MLDSKTLKISRNTNISRMSQAKTTKTSKRLFYSVKSYKSTSFEKQSYHKRKRNIILLKKRMDSLMNRNKKVQNRKSHLKTPKIVYSQNSFRETAKARNFKVATTLQSCKNGSLRDESLENIENMGNTGSFENYTLEQSHISSLDFSFSLAMGERGPNSSPQPGGDRSLYTAGISSPYTNQGYERTYQSISS